MRIEQRIAQELSVHERQVAAAIGLLDGGATVPFIARYRKEVTGSLDDTQLRQLEERLRYLRELEARRATILKSVSEQEKLTAALEKAIRGAETMARLEDLYLPFKPKRRTKAQIAREAGLEPLALGLLSDPAQNPLLVAEQFVRSEAGIDSAEAALEGARQILIEHFSEDADLIGRLRDYLSRNAVVVSSVASGKEEEGAKFGDYFSYSEPWKRVPSHRALALFRGRNEGILTVKIQENAHADEGVGHCESVMASHFRIADRGRASDRWLLDSVAAAWKTRLFKRLETDLFAELKQKAETEAIRVFANNLRDLMLAAPAGQRATMGLDPGLRTGVKVAVVDSTGKVVDTATIYPHAPAKRWDEAIAALAVLADKHRVDLVSIGNGTGSRETETLVKELRERFPQLQLTQVMVSEAGASVYSASEVAAKEFPNLDVSLRGAVSIARRLQDPLAELVKIEPKSIGVGQYQHDVSQPLLARTLDGVVEDCVNHVGVDINTASAALLSHVAGLSRAVADNVISFRDAQGAFRNRQQILKVQGIGPKSFEQAAGFMRIRKGDNPLDASGVHPEAYPVVQRVVEATGKQVNELMGNSELLQTLKAEDFADERFGVLTVRDILQELEKPGRDPRPLFRTAKFKSGVKELHDLRPGMILEGVVTNVANFGAFVDIGVHQDGLVHISALTTQFIDDPRKVVKTGDVVQVKVLEVDSRRKRISLTMRMDDQPGAKTEGEAAPGGRAQEKRRDERPAAGEKHQRERSGKDKRREAPQEKAPKTAKEQVKKKLEEQKKPPQGALAAAFAKAMADK
ncbi:RNA-binding transcriptional accessory protein [Mariprofundus erugo]|uniref:RNA-binding transcriptional accessory protein n=1 Tax=Mariprofundus erugo TaxID=2528639 RepID=A0A5R9GK05_9PROT|nr:Tex family protein [Mariprofundus erugo]TLS66931.1 RNA-binding transcriptional accessory protein [Mariprofundus erugo]